MSNTDKQPLGHSPIVFEEVATAGDNEIECLPSLPSSGVDGFIFFLNTLFLGGSTPQGSGEEMCS